VGLQSSKKSIGAENYSVLLQSPAPVIAVGVVELGGREIAPASGQQGSISNVETRTSPALDDASSYGAPDLTYVIYAPKAAMPTAVKDPPRDWLCAIMFASVRESDHPAAAKNEGGRDRGIEENRRERESLAPATCTSRGASTPQSADTGTETGEQQPASDLGLQKIDIDLEAEIGGQADEQSERVFIASAGHEVLLPPPAPVLAFCERAVELGGRIVGQQDFISNAGPRTFDELKAASICESVYLSSATSCVPLCHLSVLSCVAAYLDFVLVSTI
jgi:hypothetical protein